MLRTLSQAGDLRSKRVLLRCDLNVPLEGDRITDDGRIRASIATIKLLVEAGARVLVTSHLGRPLLPQSSCLLRLGHECWSPLTSAGLHQKKIPSFR